MAYRGELEEGCGPEEGAQLEQEEEVVGGPRRTALRRHLRGGNHRKISWSLECFSK